MEPEVSSFSVSSRFRSFRFWTASHGCFLLKKDGLRRGEICETRARTPDVAGLDEGPGQACVSIKTRRSGLVYSPTSRICVTG